MSEKNKKRRTQFSGIVKRTVGLGIQFSICFLVGSCTNRQTNKSIRYAPQLFEIIRFVGSKRKIFTQKMVTYGPNGAMVIDAFKPFLMVVTKDADWLF